MDISKIDKNFKIEKEINKNGMSFYNIDNYPFKIYGLIKEGERYLRMPSNAANAVSGEVGFMVTKTAGGRVRFKTNSKKIAVIASEYNIDKMSHCAFSGTIGFDLYQKRNGKEIYVGSFIPSTDVTSGFENKVEIVNDGTYEYTINFPLYSGVSKLLVGIEDGALLEECDDYKISKPIVYYGSSITQGGCASRPGNSYQAMISRAFDCDYVNLGFSGNAKGEDEMFEYIKNLDMSVFVYDYDHNSPSTEELEKTHKRGYEIIRKAHPDLPIIICNRPKYYLTETEEERLSVIKKTYEEALKNGDKNVYFVDNKSLMAIAKDNGTVDNCHPNDFGFYSMATALIETLKNVF